MTIPTGVVVYKLNVRVCRVHKHSEEVPRWLSFGLRHFQGDESDTCRILGRSCSAKECVHGSLVSAATYRGVNETSQRINRSNKGLSRHEPPSKSSLTGNTKIAESFRCIHLKLYRNGRQIVSRSPWYRTLQMKRKPAEVTLFESVIFP